MKKIFRQILTLLNSKDELCGKWTTEDGSGFSIVMGSWIEFNSDGTGKYRSWSSSNDDTGYDISEEFFWKRLGKTQIEIVEFSDSEKNTVDYKLEEVDKRIELSNSKITKVGNVEIKEFWNFAQIMFKSR